MPGTGPGAGAGGLPGADASGRVTPAGALPVGESVPFFLTPTFRPPWSEWSREGWIAAVGTKVRLTMECRKEGRDSWFVPCEFDPADGPGSIGAP